MQSGFKWVRECEMAANVVFDREEQAQTAAAEQPSRTKPRAVAYRADIDGLRAVAVLLVFAYHLETFTAGNVGVWGGFIGVDVFFVISGFLISSLILREIDASSFSLAEFYSRRIRRIFPALMAMLLITGLVSCYYLLPSQLYSFAKSLLAATFSLSNFYFLSNAGYFASNGMTKGRLAPRWRGVAGKKAPSGNKFIPKPSFPLSSGGADLPTAS